MELRFWLGVSGAIIVLALAKLLGVPVPWLVVFAPLWAPPLLFFIFAAVCAVIAAFAMAPSSSIESNEGDDRTAKTKHLTAQERLRAWLRPKHPGSGNMGVMIAFAAHAADSAQAANTLLM